MTTNPHTGDLLRAIWSLFFQTACSVGLIVMAFRSDVAWCVALGSLLIASHIADLRTEAYR